jgi:predicted phosphodiesterase
MLLVHGSPRALNEDIQEDRADETLDEIFQENGADVLCVGHTHKPFSRSFKGHWVINAGSVGRLKHGDPAALYCMVTISGKIEVEFLKVAYDSEAIAAAILAAGLPGAFAEQVRTGKG